MRTRVQNCLRASEGCVARLNEDKCELLDG